MLTKEEYIDIIENLDFFYGDNLITTAELRKKKHRETQEKDLENFKKKINCLKQLINEHFDNPPLKFEELKEGDWIWDSKHKEYIECNPGINSLNELCALYWYTYFNPDGELEEDYIKFEENRFYRREVK